ncbi:head decoration protein [Agrobacterium sp. NPDC090283]|uniref:head decoration protein n=1 Tax=Agrobacterium sp. NPDC090283 TaxID=3363920 RepID=UPI00383AF92E
MEHYSIKTDSDVVKDEGKNRFSRDTDTLASGSGKVIPGAVLGQVTASGKFKPLAPGASDGTQTAAAVILQYADATTADQTVVNLKRRAQVVLQALVWPAGVTDTQKSTAIAQLKALGIVPRMGV